MSDPATLTDCAGAVPSPDARLLIDQQLAMLERAAEVGMELLLAVGRQTKGEVPNGQEPAALGDLALAYSRITRALRLTVLLQSKLTGDRAFDDRMAKAGAAAAAAVEAAALQARLRDPEYVHKARVECIVERVAKGACGEDDDALDRLMSEACERLDDEDLYGKVLNRPVGELVALICRDLGLNPDWPGLSQEAWAREEIERGAEGSPFLNNDAAVRPPPRASEVGRRFAGGIPPPLPFERRA